MLIHLKSKHKVSQVAVAAKLNKSKGYINRLYNADPNANPSAEVLLSVTELYQSYLSNESESVAGSPEDSKLVTTYLSPMLYDQVEQSWRAQGYLNQSEYLAALIRADLKAQGGQIRKA